MHNADHPTLMTYIYIWPFPIFLTVKICILCLDRVWLGAHLFLTVDFIISNNQLQVCENNKKKQLANEQVS